MFCTAPASSTCCLSFSFQQQTYKHKLQTELFVTIISHCHWKSKVKMPACLEKWIKRREGTAVSDTVKCQDSCGGKVWFRGEHTWQQNVSERSQSTHWDYLEIVHSNNWGCHLMHRFFFARASGKWCNQLSVSLFAWHKNSKWLATVESLQVKRKFSCQSYSHFVETKADVVLTSILLFAKQVRCFFLLWYVGY